MVSEGVEKVNYTEGEIRFVVRKVLGLAEGTPVEITPLARGGSQRSFYRVCCDNGATVMFMHYDASRLENNYYAALAGFLRGIGVSAPRIFHHNAEKCYLLMEDLGERDLWHYRQATWEVRRKYYFKTLNIIRKLHAFRQEDFPPAGVPMMEAFGPALYRWERDYFLQNFVQAVFHIELGVADAEALEGELALLADGFAEVTPCLIHRDLQSRNVMICGDEPVLIDFQGTRYGNPFYDLGSLLYDPYVSFTEEEREELLDYYYGISMPGYDFRASREMFRKASVQRLMQALGAYGFLGLQGNHPEFLAHIPAGLDNLIEAGAANPNLYLLRNLALRCREAIKSPFAKRIEGINANLIEYR
ncbi:MAG: aminoglycoside phosphotransferase family protein, partial [Syntrophales bacterium]|nr:aminoglycoside phosphotransferase family protein [Syntrophales bacterium]